MNFWLSFVFKLSHKLKSYHNEDHEDTILSVKKIIFSDIIFEILPFRVYDNLFNCLVTIMLKINMLFVPGFVSEKEFCLIL